MNLQKSSGSISSVERLEITRGIWLLCEVAREEAVKILHNKEHGNFIVRQSKQEDRKLALSVKLGSRNGFVVKHFIIIHDSGWIFLEDSDLRFKNITSLVLHYSNVSDELPEKLRLPAILRTIQSTQTLVSLSLLGKNFWKYPMARSGVNCYNMRGKLSQFDSDNSTYSHLRCDNGPSQVNPVLVRSQSSHLIDDISQPGQTPYLQCNSLCNKGKRKTSTPPLPPRNICNSSPCHNRKYSVPNSFNRLSGRHRRTSDPSLFTAHGSVPTKLPTQPNTDIVSRSETISTNSDGHSENIISFKDSSQVPNKRNTRQRKQSVFNDRLNVVTEKVKSMNSALNGSDNSEYFNRIIEETARQNSHNKINEQKNNASYNTAFDPQNNKISSSCKMQYSTDKITVKKNNLEQIVVIENKNNEENPYTEPIDIQPSETNIYSDPIDDYQDELPDVIKEHSKLRPAKSDYRKLRYSDGNLAKNLEPCEMNNSASDQKTRKSSASRKFSFGQMIRKLSARKLSRDNIMGKETSSSQERKVSTVISKMFGNEQSHLFGQSFQVDSSSWEYLNKDIDDSHFDTKDTTSSKTAVEKGKRELKHNDSVDSVYESEFDSRDSTLDFHLSLPINQGHI